MTTYHALKRTVSDNPPALQPLRAAAQRRR
jgi:hypothetical protein